MEIYKVEDEIPLKFSLSYFITPKNSSIYILPQVFYAYTNMYLSGY